MSLIEDLEGVAFHHVMTLVGTDIMKKAVFIELVQVLALTHAIHPPTHTLSMPSLTLSHTPHTKGCISGEV